MIEARDLRKEYSAPDGGSVTAMHVESLSVERGEQIAVVGPSGSGKTTLLSILGGVLASTSGDIRWDGEPWGKAAGRMPAKMRARRVGFVFQDLNLIPSLTLLENLAAAMCFLGLECDGEKCRLLLERVGLAGKEGHKPEALSRGERQRAAIARVALHAHPLVLADEPTASLDGESAAMAMDLLCGLARGNQSALVVATHDPLVMERLERRVELRPIGKAGPPRPAAEGGPTI
ncbi:MAG: ATP-binding cassette domain-containing protein [Planctomycetota bacterium]|nr:ATP-binding cassette domain-containing protein [Planctomycetota bacterium]